jgi:mono/diheme cytochrome c family protein
MQSRLYLSLLLISSLVLIAFLGIAFNRELNPEWKKYQTEYKDFLVKNAKDDSTRERAEKIDIGLQQIYIKNLERSDRCISCHRGVENPLMADAEQPHRQHSGNYLENHPVAKFGCTVCHRGQGRAMNIGEAHGEEHMHWDFPIMPAKYIQGSCAQCHDYEMLKHEGGEKVARGEELFRQKGCQGCHKIDGKGGDLGKDIAGIGSRPYAYFPMKHVVGDHNMYNWIKQHFDDPRKIVSESEMRVFLTDEEAELLTTYMMTFVTEEMPHNYTLIKNVMQPKTDGESLYKMYCVACHADGTVSLYDEIFQRTIPAIMNPAFTKSINDEHLRTIIKEGRKGTQMTAWKANAAGLADAEINKIIKYITMNRPDEKPEPFRFSGFKVDMMHGEELYKIRCALCHGPLGKGGEGFLGINLRNPVVQNADPEFLAITVRDGRPGTPMVPFGIKGLKLSNQDIVNVVAFVKTLSVRELEAKNEK